MKIQLELTNDCVDDIVVNALKSDALHSAKWGEDVKYFMEVLSYYMIQEDFLHFCDEINEILDARKTA